jgi:PAS domain S-box-containing protein
MNFVSSSPQGRVAEDDISSDGGPDGGSPPARLAHVWRSFRAGIGWRLLVRVLFFSSVVTLTLTLIQLYVDYRRDIQAIDLRMSEIESVYSRSLGDGLWRLDARQLRLQVDGILHLPDISFVELREVTDRTAPAPFVVTAGARQINAPMRREFRISYADHGPEQLLGILTVEATFEPVYRRLLGTAVVIMITQGVKTFIVSFFFLLIVHRLITRHLTATATSLRGYNLRGSQAPLLLERRPPRSADELDGLVGAFNQMYARLQVAYGDLREREAKIRRLVDSNIIGILTIDLDGQIIEANDAFLRMVGYDREDLVTGRVRWTNAPPEWRIGDPARVATVKMTGTLQPFEKEYFRKDGSRLPALVGVARIEETNQAIAFVIDLTEQKRAEAELAHANRVATMGELAASLAHEVNQPIAATLMNAGTALRWLARQPPNLEEATQAIDYIINDSKRAADIVSRIRDLAKKAPAQRENLEINEAILEIMRLTRAAMSEHCVSVKMQLSDGLPHILGDRVQLQQVILNLIMNAIEAMSEVRERSRELTITTSAESDGVLIAVSDSGPGLPQSNPERLFDAFYTTKASGLGMGLSICRSIVEGHGGMLWATPNEPYGATFRMMLPIGETSPEGPETSAA